MRFPMILRRGLVAGLCAAAILPLAGSQAGRFRTIDKVSSKFLTFPHKVTVFLPKDYETSAKRYPVLYAHDGQNLFDAKTAFAGEWKLDENIDALVAAGLLDGLIVVGVWNNAKRIDEYTPTFLADNEYVKNQGGQLTNYARFLVEELKPLIDREYRTLPGREHTGVMGSSLGGIASYYILGLHPGTFSKAACISPSFWWDENVAARDAARLSFPADVKIYIDGGFREGSDESTMIQRMRTVYGALKKRGLEDFKNILYYEDPKGTHSEGDWAKRGRWPVHFLFGNFPAEPEKLEIELEPGTIGPDDMAQATAGAVFPGGARMTLLEGLSAAPAGVLALSNDGRLTGLTAGSATLRLTALGKTVSRTVTVLTTSRDALVLTLVVEAGEDVGSLFAEIVERDGKAVTGETLQFSMDTHAQGTLTIPARRGQKIALRFHDGDRRYACKADGTVLVSRLAMTGTRTLRLKIASWK
jgi:predicted alpha/beta superfamily hydrolase